MAKWSTLSEFPVTGNHSSVNVLGLVSQMSFPSCQFAKQFAKSNYGQFLLNLACHMLTKDHQALIHHSKY
jgi:hypothetical protein